MPALARLLTAVAACAFLVACTPSDPIDPDPAPVVDSPRPLPPGVAARITGRVEKMTGDFMPGPGSPSGTVTPLAGVPVHVFRGTLAPVATPDPKHPQLVATVTTDAKGGFSVDLKAPGRYTVVAEIDGQLYLNSYADAPDGQGGVWSYLDLAEGETRTLTIQDSSQATF